MNTVKIPFKGITRNTDDGLCQDGECMELINARIANNSVEPVSTPILKATFLDTYTKVYFHTIADMYIAIKSDKTLVSISKDLSSTAVLSTSLAGVIGIEFIGNIVCVLTEGGMKYLRWVEGVYKYLGELPELPDISIGYTTHGVMHHTTDSLFNTDLDTKTLNELIYGHFLKNIKELNQKGYFEHSTCIRIAFRLYDGSYVMHSPIRYIAPSGRIKVVDGTANGNELSTWLKFGLFTNNQEAENLITQTNYPSTGWFVDSCGFKPSFSFTPFDLSVWKDIILSIDIFASRGIRNKYNGYISYSDDSVIGWEKQPNLLESVKNISEFYKIASISLDGTLNYPQADVSVDSLVLNEQLTDDNFTHNRPIINKSYVYNSRLHIFDLSTLAYNGYDKSYLFDSSELSSNTGTIDVYVYISTPSGESIVHKQFANITLPTGITPYLMYPDSRATKMVIKITEGSIIKTKEFTLISHPKLNISYCIKSSTPQDEVIYNQPKLTSDANFEISSDIISDWNSTDISITPKSIAEIDKQKLKVSALNNPFFFPSRTTYQFQSDIMAIQSNTTALSQGQFGQFPLYVFCKDGVHAMQVGTDVV